MKKQLLLAISLSLASTFAFANEAAKADHHGKRGEHHHILKEIKKELNLTAEQEKAARQALRDTRNEHFSIVKKYMDKLPQAERDAMKKEIREMYKGKRDNFMETLSPDQQLQAKALYLKRAVGLKANGS